ncbi:N-6 DNA methylase [Schaalia canis]|uniref:DNA methylase adenine-specific domain-containing protein n=1 Tax=Schaalia canis TaxID=100469 RepID=A0A3P1SG59_9ACTO|nr:N-6 DNA methylase [Schaalia canis]RRC95910.1 hypothetical protein EII11_03395 [Schaalia canis]
MGDSSHVSDVALHNLLRETVSLEARRAQGVFFTGSKMASLLWEGVIDGVGNGAVLVDPACGVGDLLVAPLERVERNGIQDVSVLVSDVSADLAQIARMRLLNIDQRGAVQIEAMEADFLHESSLVSKATHVVLNPPFVSMDANESWASGQVNSAALFVVNALASMQEGARLLAILPDVLRSGSRYEKWRLHVSQMAKINRLKVLDVFDDHADIHVFVLDLTVGSTGRDFLWTPSIRDTTLGQMAEVRVGSVVPYRDSGRGSEVSFVTARALAEGRKLERRYEGRLDYGPFVLVNRTSRPDSSPRLRAHMWTSDEPVAVENHLIVVKPREGVECADILTVLSSPSTEDFLNQRIRCRHLTVSAIKEIPWEI